MEEQQKEVSESKVALLAEENEAETETASVTTKDTKDLPMPPFVWELLLLCGVLVYGSYSVLIHLCQVDGKLPFSSSSVVLVIEIAKFFLSIIMFVIQNWKNPLESILSVLRSISFQLAIPFAIPAALYMINNNLDVYIQLYMDPATYQVLANMKIFTTAILFRIIMKRRITPLQWFALVLLALAGVLNSIGNYNSVVPHAAASPQPTEISTSTTTEMKRLPGTLYITSTGVIMIMIYSFISGFNGVYTEYVLKQQKELSLHFQNAMLYFYGSFLNIIFFVYQASQFEDSSDGFNLFRGYSIYTWLLIISQSFLGLLMGAIMKHSNNITRLFLVSSAIVVSTALSILIFNISLNMYFLIAVFLVILSIYLYHK